MIQVNHLNLAYGSQIIFNDVSFLLGSHDRVGLVGRNGSGKSTLLKIIAHPALADPGTVSRSHHKKIGYMSQDIVLTSNKSILDETFSAFSAIHDLQEKLKAVEHSPLDEAAKGEWYAQLYEQLNELDEDAALVETKKMLLGLGFKQEQFEQPVTTLSVGWRMRIVLAKLLLQKADFYLFDEPTNHLDLFAKEWFLSFLKTAPFGFLLVCHERYFMNELCSTIIELELGKAHVYSGNFTQYETQKEERLKRLHAAYEQQQREIKKKMETVERFRAKSSKAAMAQSMLKQVEKIERIVIPPQPKNVSFQFPLKQQSGKTVLTVKDVAHSFGTKKIFDHISFAIERGQKVSIIAPNGVGKTTLFNIIAGKLKPNQGTVEFGYNVDHALFDQDQQSLDRSKTILEAIKHLCPKKTEAEIRSMLGAFLFSNDDVHKKIGVLSGGEKNRVGMVSVLMQDANLLMLDEPTNHLDIQSKEILLKALQSYQGTLIFVSHDRDFINALASHIIELTPDHAHIYPGNYTEFMHQKEGMVNHPAQAQTKAPVSSMRSTTDSSYEMRKKIARLERMIESLEKKQKQLEESFAQLAYGSPAFGDAQQKLLQIKKELSTAMQEWESLQIHS